MKTRPILRAVVVAFALGAAALAAGSCAAIPDTSRVTDVLTPDYATFAGGGAAGNAGVHTLLENRCGTLDCHGQVGRPFRLFSQYGLRAANDSGIFSSLQPDTPEEIYSNYLSAIGLQPEETSRVVAGDDPPTDLLIVSKPTGLETHKGGLVIQPGDAADLCLTGWLKLLPRANATERQLVANDCNQAAKVP